jgi:hypothetical protein
MTEWSSNKVCNILQAGPFREPAHAWLENVRNETGYGRRTRYADALVVSLWPSRGLWIGGIEVKISRNDWMRELDNPEKSVEIQRFCDYWWVAAPEGVVEKSEVPKTWGYYQVSASGKTRAKVVKAAPKLKPQALTTEFVASVLRNQSDCALRLRQLGFHEGKAKALEETDPAAIAKLKEELRLSQQECALKRLDEQRAHEQLEKLRAAITAFENAAGVTLAIPQHFGINAQGYGKDLGQQFKVAQLLARQSPERLASLLLDAGNALQALVDAAAPEEKTGT